MPEQLGWLYHEWGSIGGWIRHRSSFSPSSASLSSLTDTHTKQPQHYFPIPFVTFALQNPFMILHRAIATLLALLMLLGNAGISLHGHFCNAQLKGVNLFTNPESCHRAAQSCEHSAPKPGLRSCCKLPGQNPAPKIHLRSQEDCCSNHAQVIHLDTETDAAPSALVLPMLVAALPATSLLSTCPVQDACPAPVRVIRPPPGGRAALRLFSLLQC